MKSSLSITVILVLCAGMLSAQTTGLGTVNFSNGGLVQLQAQTPTSISSTYQMLTADYNLPCHTVNVTGGTFTMTVIASTSQPPAGSCSFINNYGSGVVTIAASGQTVNGNGIITAGGSAMLTSDGTNFGLARNSPPAGGAVGGASSVVTVNTVECASGAGALKDCPVSASIPSITLSSGTAALQTYLYSDTPMAFNQTTGISFSSGANWYSSRSTSIYQDAAGGIAISTGAASGTGGYVKGAGLMSAATKFTTSGCSVSSTTGGATAGKFTVGANTCSVVITMNGATGLTAPNGWACSIQDRTAPTILAEQSADSTTTATFSIPSGAGATDVFSFSCIGY